LKGSEAKQRVAEEENFVYLKRFDFSLAQLAERHPSGVPDRVIAAALMVTEDDVRDMYEEIVLKLRRAMKVEL
jgi:hypothetical protein